jgi:hypothetical protein
MAAKNGKWENGFPDLNTDFFSATSCSLPQQKHSRHKLENSDLWLQFWNVTSFA